MHDDDGTEGEEETKGASPLKGAFAGGVFGALGAVLLAQLGSRAVEGSMPLTLLAVAVGLVVGGAFGFFIVRRQAG